jgi:predicted lipoprotein with Yx(FWY)xxD motif
MKRLIASGMAVAAVLAIAACGGGGSGNTSDAASGGATSVSVRQLSGVGRVLVDDGSKAVYTSDQEANGKIVCSAGCTSFWKPVTAGGGKPASAAGTGKLGEIKRPDGTTQLTANGRPLYTFSEDAPGKAKGDGFKDDFDGHHFTWHVVRSGGTTSAAKAAGGGGQQNQPSGTGPSSDNYGY